MKTSLIHPKANSTDRGRQPEDRYDVVLMKQDDPNIRSMTKTEKASEDEMLEMIRSIRSSASRKSHDGSDAARSQDFLYDENGLPK